jgi:hypothetical protein
MNARSHLHEQINRNQNYHAPVAPEIADHLASIREQFMALSHDIADACPDNPHLRRGLDLIDNAQMYAIKACVTDQAELADMLGLDLPGS